MAEPILSLVVNGGGGLLLLALGLALLSLRRGRDARLLGAYLAVTGSLFVWVHVARWVDDPRDASAAFAASRAPFYYAWLLLVLFASAHTGIHEPFWRRRAVLVIAAALPTLFLVLDIATPPGVPFPYFSLSIFLLTCSFVYANALFATALRRERDPAMVPGRALLLAAFAIVGTVSLVELLHEPDRWRFLLILAGFVPPLVPDSLPLLIAISIGVALLPALRVARAPANIRSKAYAALAIAAFVAPMSLVAAAPTTAEGDTSNIRWLLFALLVAYASLRHGYLGARRARGPVVEYPLAAAGFGALVLTFLVPLQLYLTTVAAMGIAVALAILVGAILVGLSDARHAGANARYEERASLGRSETLALDRQLRREVVLVRLPSGEEVLARARAAVRVSHPSLVAIHDVAADAEGAFVVREHVAGPTLDERLAKERLSPADIERLRSDLSAALATAHAAGLVHGGVDPGRVFFRADGRAVLAGLGTPGVAGDAVEDARALDRLMERAGET